MEKLNAPQPAGPLGSVLGRAGPKCCVLPHDSLVLQLASPGPSSPCFLFKNTSKTYRVRQK